jgi:origin recognition complex subunit 3
MGASLPDISILYKIYLEFGRCINLQDWFLAFISVLGYDMSSEAFEKDQALLTLCFFQCVSELHFLGFIKLSGKKANTAIRLVFDTYMVN